MKYQVMPDLTPVEYEALKADIAANGVLVPVEVDEDGNTLDGHHRIRAWQELKDEGRQLPEYPFILRPGMTEAQKRNHARRLNIQRRHLTAEQKAMIARELVQDREPDTSARGAISEAAELTGLSERRVEQVTADIRQEEKEQRNQRIQELADLGWSQRDIADEVGVTQKTVSNIVGEKKSKDFDFFSPLPGIIGTGEGGMRKAAKLAEYANGGVVTVGEAKQVAKDFERAAKKEATEKAIAELPDPAAYDGDVTLNTIALCDIHQLHLPQNSIDMVFTDPPYHDEFVDLYAELARVAAVSLKPGGYLMTYAGKMFLPEIMECMRGSLEYVSMCAVFQPFSKSKIVKHAIFENWRPILIYKKVGKTETREWAQDVVRGTRNKDFHDWQQDAESPLQYIAAYTKPGDVVLDPFVGGGTTVWACKQLGRYYLGFDADESAVKIATERVRNG